MIVLPYLDNVPQIGANVSSDDWVAVIGRATIGSGCKFGKLATLRADGNDIQIGSDCWFGEASTVHIADKMFGTRVGNNVTVGRFGLVHACTIGDNCVLGEHAVVMDGAVVGPESVIAGESVVPPGKQLEGGWLYSGIPARPVERISPERVAELRESIRNSADIADSEVIRAKSPVGQLRNTPGTGIDSADAEGAYIAPTASIKGKLELAPTSSVWFAVEINAEGATVELGEASNIQDNTRVYLSAGERLRIGRRVTVGHNVRMHSGEIEDETIIGMGCTLGKGTIVRKGAVVAAGAVTAPYTEVEAGMIWSGQPAVRSKELSEDNRARFAMGVDIYVGYAAKFRAASKANQAAST